MKTVKARPLTPDQWAEMKTRYQMGDGIREIARDYAYDAGNLSRKFRKEGVIPNELRHMIDKKVVQIAETIKTITPEIEKITSPSQRQGIQHLLNERAAKWLGIVENTTDLALKFNHKILIETIAKAEQGGANSYGPQESTQILRSIVATQSALLEQTGISAKPKDPDKEGKTAGVTFYLPDNRRDKK